MFSGIKFSKLSNPIMTSSFFSIYSVSYILIYDTILVIIPLLLRTVK